MTDFEKVLDSTPLFMRDTPVGGEENEVLEALRSLMFEGDGDGERPCLNSVSFSSFESERVTLDYLEKEIATNFKNHGNELYAQKSYRQAIQAYSQGLEAGPDDPILRESLLNNRAACNLALKNFGAVLKDTRVIIALASVDGKDPPVKAMYRAAQSLVALERWDEARDCVGRAKMLGGETGVGMWKFLEEEVNRGQRRMAERLERERREKSRREALKRALLVSIDHC